MDSVVATGGSGVVSKAFDLVSGRAVAMKRLASSKLPTEKDLQRAQTLLEREYYVLSELAHPKIIEVYDYGVDDEGAYYTMEWLEGTSLRQRTPLSVPEACVLLRDVASSLAIVHSRRLVHRDVTPHNVHCARDGGAKLIDFGAMTPVGVPKLVVGTPPFMAPECLDYQAVDGRTDLFSLGACLYFALTGRHAYAARTTRELPEIWRYSPVWPSRFVSEIPDSLDRLILELLSLKPAGRPGSAAEVFERLSAIGGLDAGETPAVARAYVASPALAGRREKLAPIVRRTLRAARGRGSSVVLTGLTGVGRSRMLRAAMLEAKIAGFVVLQADAVPGVPAPFAAMQSM
ncbi:MAG TPA: serine/threonine-protein kinase, partial [Polyangiaceae bacterium]|nr:serine/threonine-protein kinase [Polyangiaceae bacterium]